MKQYDAQALIAQIYRFYPRNIDVNDRRYLDTQEYQRLYSVLIACSKSMGAQGLVERTPGPIDDDVAAVIATLQTWPSFVAELRRELSDCVLWNNTIPWADPCYSCRVSMAESVGIAGQYDRVIILLSALAPVYAIYASHVIRGKESWIRYADFPGSYQAYESLLAARVEETFGVTRVYEDTLFLSIPDVVPRASNLGLGEAKLIDCIFTSHRF